MRAREQRLRGNVGDARDLSRLREENDAAFNADDLLDDCGAITDRRDVTTDIKVGFRGPCVAQKIRAFDALRHGRHADSAGCGHLLSQDLRDCHADTWIRAGLYVERIDQDDRRLIECGRRRGGQRWWGRGGGGERAATSKPRADPRKRRSENLSTISGRLFANGVGISGRPRDAVLGAEEKDRSDPVKPEQQDERGR